VWWWILERRLRITGKPRFGDLWQRHPDGTGRSLDYDYDYDYDYDS